MQATCAPNEQHMPSADFSAPLRREQLKDDSLGPLIQYLGNGTLPDDVKMTKVILNTCAEYEILHGVLVKRYFPPGKTPKEDRIIKQLMVPSTLRGTLLKSYHDDLPGGHQGYERTFERLKLKYWWHSMSKDTKLYVESCDVCQ